MNPIKYRPIEERDYPTVCGIISDSFGLPGYVGNSAVLSAFKKQYLYSCLAEAGYTCVAEKEGSVVGVIMGNAKSHAHFCSKTVNSLKTLYYLLKMQWLAKRNHENASEYKKLHAIYNGFTKKHGGEFDGVLTLFAVAESARGHGVGKQLWHNLKEYLVSNGVRKIYLFTDSTCNTGFYDSQGFKRIESQIMPSTRNGEKTTMDVFLYIYQLEEKIE